MTPTPRWVGLLIRCYPEPLRTTHRDEIAEFIVAQMDERRYRGPLGRLRLALHIIGDTLRSVPREQTFALAARTERGAAMTPAHEDHMATLLYDIRHALRTLLHHPAFALTVILTLMLGVGANTAIFSVVDAVLLKPLPYPAADRLVMIWGTAPKQPSALIPIDAIEGFRKRTRMFEEVGLARSQSVNLTGTDHPDRLTGNFIVASTLRIFGATAALGRLFTDDETRIGAGAQVAVLSYDCWRTRFGADPSIIGRTLLLNGRPHQVIGVAAHGFAVPMGPDDVWLPITSAPSAGWFDPSQATVWAFGKLKPGVTVQQAQQEWNGISRQLIAEQPLWAGTGVSLTDLHKSLVGSFGTTLLIILGAVGVLLLIACANVANLQLTRATTRAREMSVRAAIGASHSRLIRQLLTESVVLSILGGVAGVALAYAVMRTLVAAIPGGLPGSGATLDLRVLGFTLGITVITGLLFGLAPALHAARADIHSVMRTRGSEARGRGVKLRDGFVAVQLALAIILLAAAGLFTRSLLAFQHADTGFRTDHLLTAEFRLPIVKYSHSEMQLQFMQQALDALHRVPGVRAVALARAVPLGGNWGGVNYVPEGMAEPANGAAPSAQQNSVSEGFFATMGIPLLQGRDFNSGDRPTSNPVVIVNRHFAETHWPGVSPLGRHVRIIGPPDVDATVVGVVGNITHRFVSDAPTPQIYVPMSQTVGIFNSVVMRTVGDPDLSAAALRNAIWSVDPDQPVWKIRSMDTLLQIQSSGGRFTMMLTGAFAIASLLLAAVGVYSVMAFAVAQRTREVGIRMALGARRQQVVRMVVRRGATVVMSAVAIGGIASVFAVKLIGSQLYAITPGDPIALLGAPALLASIALLACWLPALRAARVDPAVTLRGE